MSDTADQVGAVLEEAVKEAIGTSHKKWALVIVAFGVGALGAAWWIRRTRSAYPATVEFDVETT